MPDPYLTSTSLVGFAQRLLLRNFREHQSRNRFAVLRVGRPSWRQAGDRFTAAPAPGFEPLCAGCLNYAGSPMLVCAVHPHGPQGQDCRDYRERTDPPWA